MYLASFLPLAVLPFAFAVQHNVTVGADKENKPGLVFSPDTLSPKINDTVVFTFIGDKHSVVQSEFDEPCTFAENGVFSGFPGPSKTFTIHLNNTDPIWLYCSQEGHCQGGQVMVLNPPRDKTIAQYKAAAQRSDATEDEEKQPPVRGGVVADASPKADSTSTASSSSKATPTSGSSTSTGSTTAGSTTAGGASGTTASPSSTPTGAAGRLTVGTGLGAMGLLSFFVGGMI